MWAMKLGAGAILVLGLVSLPAGAEDARSVMQQALMAQATLPEQAPQLPSQASETARRALEARQQATRPGPPATSASTGKAAADAARGDDDFTRLTHGAASSAAHGEKVDSRAAQGQLRANEARAHAGGPDTGKGHGHGGNP